MAPLMGNGMAGALPFSRLGSLFAVRKVPVTIPIMFSIEMWQERFLPLRMLPVGPEGRV